MMTQQDATIYNLEGEVERLNDKILALKDKYLKENNRANFWYEKWRGLDQIVTHYGKKK